ncbi:uncharacterized protein [Periplaneta americana]|uniref:uncharacterized protein n=1 Tax=Periplaneta americana TaxID=6978 RepID=UPI0037E89673
MELPTEYLRYILKSVLRDLKIDPESEHESKQIAAHLLLSALYRVTVHYNNGTNTKNFILKTLRTDPAINDKFETAVFFKNEVMFYTKVAVAFEIFQSQRLDEKYAPFHSYPICYKGICDSSSQVLVLEDLTERGFVESDRQKKLNFQELNLVMEEIGRFHALSLAIKHKDPNLFTDLKNNSVKEAIFRTEFLHKTYNTWGSSVAAWVLKLAKESFQPGSLYITRLESFATEDMVFIMKERISPKIEDEQYNVFTHGDLWVNNLLFQYQETENDSCMKPVKMKFVDFQNCRYGSVALDIAVVLFLFMDQEMRNNHRDELLQAYHHSLCKFLSQFDCDPETIFPFCDLEVQLSKYSLYSLGMAFLCLSYNLTDDGEEDFVIQENEDSTVSRTTKECRSMIVDVIKECVDRGYLI